MLGFFQFKQQEDSVEVGLGLHPDWIGRGLGVPVLGAGLAFARRRFTPAQFRLAVATFNTRAIRVYERVGFQRVRLYMQATNGGWYEFLEMVRWERRNKD